MFVNSKLNEILYQLESLEQFGFDTFLRYRKILECIDNITMVEHFISIDEIIHTIKELIDEFAYFRAEMREMILRTQEMFKEEKLTQKEFEFILETLLTNSSKLKDYIQKYIERIILKNLKINENKRG